MTVCACPMLPDGSAGRVCPEDYRLDDGVFRGAPALRVDALYVAGGVYGNLQALAALEGMVAQEPGARLVLNGDLHWFDAEPGAFAAVEGFAERHLALVGNVEAELRRDADVGAGCGCAYPASVGQEAVERSNAIHRRLGEAVSGLPGLLAQMKGRPMSLLAEVVGRRVAVVHGDEQALAGWGCSRESLRDAGRQRELRAWMQERGVSVLATSHTCAPAAWAWEGGAVVNNGAAGMPNFAEPGVGLVTRIGAAPDPRAIYRAQANGLAIEALPLAFDQAGFLAWFDRLWPDGSPAAVSYRQRILRGTNDKPPDALLPSFALT